MSDASIPNPFADARNPLQQLDSDIQALTRAVNRIAEILQTPTGAPPTVSGSRGGNAALQSLLSALSGAGLIIDNTTP